MEVFPPFWIWQCHVVARRPMRRFSPVKPEVNLHNEACADKAQTRVLAFLVSPRTPCSPFYRRLENVSILGLFSPTTDKAISIPFSDILTLMFLKIIFFTIFVGNISKWEKKAIIYIHHCLFVLQSWPLMFLSAQWRKVNQCKWS